MPKFKYKVKLNNKKKVNTLPIIEEEQILPTQYDSNSNLQESKSNLDKAMLLSGSETDPEQLIKKIEEQILLLDDDSQSKYSELKIEKHAKKIQHIVGCHQNEILTDINKIMILCDQETVLFLFSYYVLSYGICPNLQNKVLYNPVVSKQFFCLLCKNYPKLVLFTANKNYKITFSMVKLRDEIYKICKHSDPESDNVLQQEQVDKKKIVLIKQKIIKIQTEYLNEVKEELGEQNAMLSSLAMLLSMCYMQEFRYMFR
ncbi:hypothetical protein AB837_00498 [bacterium AB1]|nr:hypothetical protein AB837_00498 [bacterium AB1]